MKKIVLGTMIVVCAMLCCSFSASADEVYQYSGDFLYSIHGPTGLTVDVWMDLAAPLGDNFSGNVTPIGWNVGDLHLNQSNAFPGSVTFFFQTNSSGQIVGWNVGASDSDGAFGTYNLDGFAGDSLVSYDAFVGFSNVDDPGTWTSTVSPEPATLVLLATGMLGLGAAVRMHRG